MAAILDFNAKPKYEPDAERFCKNRKNSQLMLLIAQFPHITLSQINWPNKTVTISFFMEIGKSGLHRELKTLYPGCCMKVNLIYNISLA